MYLGMDFGWVLVWYLLKSIDSRRNYSSERETCTSWNRHHVLSAQIPWGDGARQHDLHGLNETSKASHLCYFNLCKQMSACIYSSVRVWLHMRECPILPCFLVLFTARLFLISATIWGLWGSDYYLDSVHCLKLCIFYDSLVAQVNSNYYALFRSSVLLRTIHAD